MTLSTGPQQVQPSRGLPIGEPPALAVRGITKRFDSLVAVDRVDLDLRAGRVHALLGENGAGKTTLMNIVSGLLRPDEGSIELDGRRVEVRSPREAIRLGIGMVHQHFMLVPVMSVAENIVLGNEPRRGPLLDMSAARRRVRQLSESFGLAVDADASIGSVSVAQQQRVEILKALYRDARILIFDEPTAVLTPPETIEFFGIVRSLTARGTAVAFISHKLPEVLEIADEITVVRAGLRVATLPRAEVTEGMLARLMVGRDVAQGRREAGSPPGAVALRITGLTVLGERGERSVDRLDLEVRRGEIVGLAGVDGNGQAEVVDALVGLRRPIEGSITTDTGAGDRLATSTGSRSAIGYIPEDRRRRGLVLDLSLAENLALDTYREPPLSRYGVIDQGQMRASAADTLAEFDVRGGGPSTPARSLSGGNQQKVVIARELTRDPAVLLASQPTRGLDIGATEFVRDRLRDARDRGGAVLLVSFDLDEILALADRIAVLYEGRIIAEFQPDASVVEIGLAMAGRVGITSGRAETA